MGSPAALGVRARRLCHEAMTVPSIGNETVAVRVHGVLVIVVDPTSCTTVGVIGILAVRRTNARPGEEDASSRTTCGLPCGGVVKVTAGIRCNRCPDVVVAVVPGCTTCTKVVGMVLVVATRRWTLRGEAVAVSSDRRKAMAVTIDGMGVQRHLGGSQRHGLRSTSFPEDIEGGVGSVLSYHHSALHVGQVKVSSSGVHTRDWRVVEPDSLEQPGLQRPGGENTVAFGPPRCRRLPSRPLDISGVPGTREIRFLVGMATGGCGRDPGVPLLAPAGLLLDLGDGHAVT